MQQVANQKSNVPESRISILSDAWFTLDTLNRLRVLIGSYPDASARTLPAVVLFLNRAKSVETVRNRFQHLAEQLSRRVELEHSAQAILGQVSWVFCPHPEEAIKPVFIFGIVGGSAPQNLGRQQSINVSPIGGQKVEIPVGRFEVHAFGKLVRLSEQIENMMACVPALEVHLIARFQARANRIAEERGLNVEVLLKPIIECSGFQAQVGFGGEGPSADGELKVVTSYHTPCATF
ncbi:MAG: hypothetical protein K2P94_10890 [Rhodospirillaceae bacterium]|nr:hypothetical protein [Rhodospirillaceae bacterium]